MIFKIQIHGFHIVFINVLKLGFNMQTWFKKHDELTKDFNIFFRFLFLYLNCVLVKS